MVLVSIKTSLKVVKKKEKKRRECYVPVVGLFWLKWAGLPPMVLGPSILNKRVETGPTTTQFGPACAQIRTRLPGARLRRVELLQIGCGKQI